MSESGTERYDLLAAETCPECDSRDGWVEHPAGYYTCRDCAATWAGDLENAKLIQEGMFS